MKRMITDRVTGFRTQDGAGVSLVRVLGNRTTDKFDPILMLDSFDSVDPEEYTAGFPIHPHRGIETVSYIWRGKMMHKDSMGNSDTIGDGEVQWMNSGSGIMHEEQLPASERMLGVQLWLNLPASAKMSKPYYKSIKNDEIAEIPFEGGYLRLISGRYKEYQGYQGEHLKLDYYDLHIEKSGEVTIETDSDDSVMLFTLLGNAVIDGEMIPEKTAVKLSNGDSITIAAGDEASQVLFIASKALNEPIAWAGPIVMNTRDELDQAFADLSNGSFIKNDIDY